MASSKLTLIGLYNYDPTIFDNLIFPAGIDKDIAVDEILMRSGEFEIIYPNPDFLRVAITHWGKKHFRTFDKWIQALALEFDPLYNYDRYEEYTDEKTGAHTQSHTDSTKAETSSSDVESMTDARSSEGTSAETEGHATTGTTSGSDQKTANSVSATDSASETDETKTRSVSAYDAATYQNREQEVTNNASDGGGNGIAASEETATSSGSTSETGNTAKTGYTGEDASETSNASRSGVTGSESESAGNIAGNSQETATHKAHLYGNIGVTTSTQMLEDFIRVERFNIYENIADIFIDEFCIMVY